MHGGGNVCRVRPDNMHSGRGNSSPNTSRPRALPQDLTHSITASLPLLHPLLLLPYSFIFLFLLLSSPYYSLPPHSFLSSLLLPLSISLWCFTSSPLLLPLLSPLGLHLFSSSPLTPLFPLPLFFSPSPFSLLTSSSPLFSFLRLLLCSIFSSSSSCAPQGRP